jgi:hypothetical protein
LARTTFMGTYVDDGAMTGVRKLVIAYIIQIRDDFDTDPPEYLKKLLGAEYTRLILRSGRALLIHQGDYSRYCLEQFLIDNAGAPREADTPYLDVPRALNEQRPGLLGIFARKHLGALLYLARTSRPDVLTSVSLLTREVEAWSIGSDVRLRRVFGYLKRFPALGLLWFVRDTDDGGDFTMLTRSDSDHGGDLTTARSTSGWVGYLVTASGSRILLEWYTRRQGATAKSSTEAEILATNDCATKTALPLLDFLQEVQECDEEPSWEHATDSEAGRMTIAGQKASPLTYMNRHQRINLGFLRDVFNGKEYPRRTLVRVDTKSNEADLFTKDIPVDAFQRHVATLGMVPIGDYLVFREQLPPLELPVQQTMGDMIRRGARAAGSVAVGIAEPLGTLVVRAAGDQNVRDFVMRRLFRGGQ